MEEKGFMEKKPIHTKREFYFFLLGVCVNPTNFTLESHQAMYVIGGQNPFLIFFNNLF